jgi:PAS domain S-box-containing protein
MALASFRIGFNHTNLARVSMKPRIFVVEDEAVVALDIRHRLQELGYDVAGMASSGEDAMSAVGVTRPDVVLMDVNLGGGIDGIETAARVREHFHIPVVFLTAFSDAELIARIRLTEPFAYVLKPFEEAELHAAIEIALLRHRLENTIREQKQLLAATLDNIDDGGIVAGTDGAIRYMNPVAEALTGWTADEAIGHQLHDVYAVLPPATLVSRDGKRYDVDFRSNMMVDDAGTWSGFVHTFTDVSEREASRRALEQREKEYRMLMEQAADAILIGETATQRIIAVNMRACELLGYRREELLAMKYTDLVDPEQLVHEPIRQETLERQASFHAERRLVCHDGRRIDVDVSGRGMSDGRVQVSLHDITERKRTEEEFHEAVRSEAVDKLLRKLHALRHGESAAVNLSRIGLFLQNVDSLRSPAPPVDGKHIAPLQRFRMIIDEFERIVVPQLTQISSLIVIVESDRGSSATSFRGIGPRLATATQGLRTLLPEILLLLADAGQDAHLREHLKEATTMVEEIREVSRQAHAVMHEEFTCDAVSIVQLVTGKFVPVTPGITVTAETSQPLMVVMNGAELGDVVGTLITNALEACVGSDQQAVDVRLSHAGRRVLIEVEDNGPGISEADRAKIFEDAFSTKGTGRGFGLGYAQRCLEGCGGVLRLDHTGPAGTRFVVELARVTTPHGSHSHH